MEQSLNTSHIKYQTISKLFTISQNKAQEYLGE